MPTLSFYFADIATTLRQKITFKNVALNNIFKCRKCADGYYFVWEKVQRDTFKDSLIKQILYKATCVTKDQ